jgi:D-3-phosphoglycerate dehydrogenase / 2-oxoglutarate reductase
VIRILNAEPFGYSPDAARILAELGQVTAHEFTREQLLQEIETADALIVRLGFQIDQEMIDAGKSLKAIVTASTGLDHIDFTYAHSKQIAVLSLRGETEFIHSLHATAEHTWALLLALVRQIPSAFDAVKKGEWDRDAFRGNDLEGKRLGIVGLGRIGRRVAHYGLAFGMPVFAYNPRTSDLVPGVTRVFTLTELLEVSDVLSLHAHLNEETRGFIGSRELAQLPKGALLVNTARGEILDEHALVTALEQQHLAGAALDVMAHERETQARSASPLVAYAQMHTNLLITPHVGGATYDTMTKSDVFMAHKLTAFFKQGGNTRSF